MPIPDPHLVAFMGGVTATACMVAATFFLRFWVKTQDRLFLAFAVAFGLMSLNQALPVFLGPPSEAQAPVYLLRLAAFVVIILAIVGKNLGDAAD